MPRTAPLEVYEALVARGAEAAHGARVGAMRQAFMARTGPFGPDDPWFEARSRAFWDDALTTQGFGAYLVATGEVRAEHHPWAQAFGRAHRGLFRVEAGRPELVDMWSGAAFVADVVDGEVAHGLAGGAAFVDARIAGLFEDGVPSVVVLPGALFHPEEAADALEALLPEARRRFEPHQGGHPALDAFLRMEHRLRAHSRVKPGHVYRADRLAVPVDGLEPSRKRGEEI